MSQEKDTFSSNDTGHPMTCEPEDTEAIRAAHNALEDAKVPSCGLDVFPLTLADRIRILDARRATAETKQPAVIDAAHIARQRDWSTATFGPGSRLLGVLEHVRKECDEIEANPTDLSEWVDVMILVLDGAWRAGHEPQQIIDAIKEKQARNEAREWPDWRTASPDHAIEHVREPNEPQPDLPDTRKG